MVRYRGTTTRGGGFEAAIIREVWRKGAIVAGYNPDVVRKDCCGMWMVYADYGKQSEYGWEIDHGQPVSKGGSDHVSNLQPLYWRNNLGKSDNYPRWYCTIPVN